MERLQAAVLAACVMSMVTGMLQLLRPNEKFDRQLRLLTAGMMLFSILIPLMQGISDSTRLEFFRTAVCGRRIQHYRTGAGTTDNTD